MLRVLSTLVIFGFTATSVQAGFLLDDFDVPAPGGSQNSGTGGAPTGESLSAPNFFTDGNTTTDERFLLGSVNTNLVVANGDLSGVLSAGETAYIEWTNPSTVPRQFQTLEFLDYVPTLVNNATYDVTLNGTSIGSGTLGTSPFLTTSLQTFNATTDELRVTFTATGLTIFRASGIQANPEPASAGLLGLLLLGGGVRHRRRRRRC